MQVGIWVRLEPQLCQDLGQTVEGRILSQDAQGWICVGVYRAGFGSDCTGHDLGQTAQCRIWVRLHTAGFGSDCTGQNLGQAAQGPV